MEYANSSNQAATLKENTDDQEVQHFADGGTPMPAPDSADAALMGQFDSFLGSQDATATPEITAPIGDNEADLSHAFDSFLGGEEEGKKAAFGTTTEQLKAGLEGAAQGVLGPLAPLAEQAAAKLIYNQSPEETSKNMLAREEVNPGTHAIGQAVGLGGSLLTGVGEAALVAKGAEAAFGGIKAASLAGRLGTAAAKAALENVAIQTGDEISHMIMKDPKQSVETALTDVGLSGLIGGALGGAGKLAGETLGKLGGGKAAQTIEDFKGRLDEHLNNPDPKSAIIEELSSHYDNVTRHADEVYGASGLKAQEIQKLMPTELSEPMVTQSQNLVDKLSKSLEKMEKDPHSFPQRFVSKFSNDVNRYNEVISNLDATPHDIFNATQELKQSLQSYAKIGKKLDITSDAYDFTKEAKGVAHELRQALEDSSVWGKAAERQKEINGAFSKFLPSLQEFEKKFTIKIADPENGGFKLVIDPGKVSTFYDSLGKMKNDIKENQLANFLKQSEKYQDVIADTHANLGLESPVEASSLNATMKALQEPTTGGKLADILVHKLGAEGPGQVAGAGIGGVIGSLIGHPVIGAYVGKEALAPFINSTLAAIAKPLVEAVNNPAGLKAAAAYGAAIARGQSLITKAAKAVMTPGREVLPKALMPTHKDREELNKYIEQLQSDPTPLTKLGDNTGHYMPGHGPALTETAGTAIRYLSSIKPSTQKQAPLDSKPVVNPVAQAKYDNALNIAQQPLIVLDKMKKGTLNLNDLEAFTQMYPTLYSKLQNNLVDQMITSVSKDQSIPYSTRMSMSLFLGKPLDSTMTPQSISSVQALQGSASAQSQQTNAPAQNGGMAKGYQANAIKKVPSQYLTPEQAKAVHRQQK